MKNIFTLQTTILILSLVGSGLVVLTTSNYSIGLWPDSVGYIATAGNLLDGKGFISFDDKPVIYWPPLYPLLLSLISYITGLDLLVSAILLNALLFGLIIYKLGMLLTKYIDSVFIIIIGVISILISKPIFALTLWAASEILFIFLITWYFHFLISYFEKGNILSFIMLVIVTALAILTRYIGITLILTSAITILIYSQELMKKRIRLILFYSILSLIPISLWLIRNYLISETLFGVREKSSLSFISINLTLSKTLNWFIPADMLSTKVLLFIVVLILIVSGFLLFKKNKVKNLLSIRDKQIIVILISFITIYTFTLIAISTIKYQNPIDDRLLSPVYFPLIFLFLFFYHLFYTRITENNHPKSLKIFILLSLNIILIYPLSHALITIDNHLNNGGGYTGTQWKNYETEKFLKNITENYEYDFGIYSNDPHAVYFLTNLKTDWSPFKNYDGSNKIIYNLTELDGVWPVEKRAYLVWFRKQENRSWLFNPNELASISEMQIVDSSSQGSIYLVAYRKKN